jgi:hypothetical protein
MRSIFDNSSFGTRNKETKLEHLFSESRQKHKPIIAAEFQVGDSSPKDTPKSSKDIT